MASSPRSHGLSAMWFTLLFSLLILPFTARAGPANTSAVPQIPQNVEDDAVYFFLTLQQPSVSSTYRYFAGPLTPQVGLGESNAPKAIFVEGRVTAVNASNFETFNTTKTVALISCDQVATNGTATNGTNVDLNNSISPNTILNAVMARKPKAIVLYSLVDAGCTLTGDNLTYTSIWTMVVVDQARNAVAVTSAMDGYVATITAHDLSADSGSGPGSGPPPSGSNSGVAMSILYSITGLITALFLIIIITGAVRAHRNPERYGPRAGLNGRTRQSRAKGIARAMLETLPIVKFGDPKPTKPDPEIEIDTLPGDRQRAVVAGNEASSSHTRPSTDRNNGAQATTSPNEAVPEAATEPTAAPVATAGENSGSGQVGCSICTEDFEVGEDVRVLPCDHNFHPGCIDPWLLKVSGTCPLCRLDLRQTGSNEETASQPDGNEASNSNEPRPAESTPVATEVTSDAQRQPNRVSRLLHPGRPRSEHVDPLTMVENRQTHIPAEGSEHDQRRMERILRVFRIRTRRQEPTAS
ncbi:hypothetical protein Micbo1qcDRAFT_229724 [Microdochium bolleyi]|uniref:RING-type domain-containing protein n=1 Tax=Microdochium bolleyi TaxID=196109 RepID=A0A136JIJ5_9PEZI|nr:hypothetical protein Micbo1qcDRAFT_229724 [Microdochium bolleyi]